MQPVIVMQGPNTDLLLFQQQQDLVAESQRHINSGSSESALRYRYHVLVFGHDYTGCRL